MKNHKLVLEIPVDFDYDSQDVELQNQKDIEELYKTHKYLLLDLIENMIINDNLEYEVTIEKIKKEKS